MRISMDSTSELPDLNGRDDQESTITPESPTAKELLSRTTLETHKLDMMAEISQLKLKLATSDKRGKEMDRKLMDSQKRVDELQIRLNDRTLEVTELRLKTPRNGTIPNNNSDTCGDLYRDRTLEREKTLDRLKRKHSEVDRLKKAVESLVAANDEKERHIDDLRKTMQKYKRLEEVILSSQGRKVLETLGFDDERSDTSSNPLSSASSQDTHPLRDYMQPLHHSRDSLDDYSRRTNSQMPAPSATSTPVSGYNDPKPLHTMGQHEHPYQAGSNLYATTPPSLINMDTPRRRVASTSLQRSNSAEDINSRQKTPSTVRKRADGYGTLPKDLMLSVNPTQSTHPHTHNLPPPHPSMGAQGATMRARSTPSRSSSFRTPGSSPRSSLARRKPSRLSSFSKGFLKLRPSRWTTSAPNLGKGYASEGEVGSEAEDEALKDSMAQEYKALASTGGVPESRPTQPPGASKKTSKGFRRFFNRLKRSNSQDLDPDELEDFKRSSALRSTAGPRLGWSRDTRHTELEVPFSRWDADRVTTWLHHLGFTTYGKECRRWIKNGQQLLKASSAELEKDFGMKNYFHRKKLMLHVQAKGSEQTSTMDDLDHNWVTRWLDDVGLPQYKTEFSQALIDGRVLNYLTVDDLRVLTVVNTLHLLSFKRAIQVLRQNDFNPIVLKRRPSNDESHHQCGPHEVMLWTNHRVMEWLRTIDLSEYAPNLRGSGVHGALMVLEPRFGAEIFATLLSIPSTKTLLRRHLSTHFIRLIGQEMQHYKREQEATPGFMPLTPNQKIKTRKFNLFNSHRRARSENEVDDYVCPMDNLGPLPAVHTNGNATKIQLTTSNLSSGTPYASDVTAMTHMLNKDPFMDNVPTSNV